MNVFVLTTGRSGSHTFAAACSHFTNYTSAHESRQKHEAGDRLDYPGGHIEVDNRLSWMLGPLAARYPDAFYVHLVRDPDAVVATYLRFWRGAMMAAWRGIRRPHPNARPREVVEEFVATTNANIACFLETRPHVRISIEEPHNDFDVFGARIGAAGDIAAAHRALDERHGSKARR